MQLAKSGVDDGDIQNRYKRVYYCIYIYSLQSFERFKVVCSPMYNPQIVKGREKREFFLLLYTPPVHGNNVRFYKGSVQMDQ